MVYPVMVPVPDGDELVAVVALRRQPDGNYAAEYHPAASPQVEVMKKPAAARLLRWLADALDIDALPEVPGG